MKCPYRKHITLDCPIISKMSLDFSVSRKKEEKKIQAWRTEVGGVDHGWRGGGGGKVLLPRSWCVFFAS